MDKQRGGKKKKKVVGVSREMVRKRFYYKGTSHRAQHGGTRGYTCDRLQDLKEGSIVCSVAGVWSEKKGAKTGLAGIENKFSVFIQPTLQSR